MRFACLPILALFAATVSAQTVQYESLTAAPWSHSSSGTWNNGVVDSRSTFGKLDHLVSATSFSYTRAILTLQPGTYVADVRFAKATSTAGAEDITFGAIGTLPIEVVTLAADQTPDIFLNTKALLITVTSATPVFFSLQNTDTSTTKSDYLFDSFHIGKVERGQAVLVESMGRRWGHAWGAPHYCKEHADPTAQFGFVERLNPNGSSNCGTGAANLWWFEWTSGRHQFLPGEHTFNCRIKKVNSAVGAHDFDVWVRKSVDQGQNWTNGPKFVWKASRHPVGEWVYSPNVTFDVTDPNHLYQFKLARTSGSFKADYYFDSFEVRRGSFMPSGNSCMNNGEAEMHGNVPQLGLPFDITVGPLGANTNPVTMILGVTNPSLDLSIVGWTGCFQYASLNILLGMPINLGTASFSANIPNNPTLIGFPFFTQAFQPTATGVETTNGVNAMIVN